MHRKSVQALIGILLLSVIGAAVLFIRPQQEVQTFPLENAADCTAFLLQRGIAVKQPPIVLERILLPSVYNGTYENYLCLQEDQGLSLRACAGEEAELYLYESAADRSVFVTLIVCDKKLVGADIGSFENGELKPLLETGSKKGKPNG